MQDFFYNDEIVQEFTERRLTKEQREAMTRAYDLAMSVFDKLAVKLIKMGIVK